MSDQIVWLSTAQVANRLHLSQDQVSQLIRERKLAAVRVGRRYRVREDVLRAYQETADD